MEQTLVRDEKSRQKNFFVRLRIQVLIYLEWSQAMSPIDSLDLLLELVAMLESRELDDRSSLAVDVGHVLSDITLIALDNSTRAGDYDELEGVRLVVDEYGAIGVVAR